MSLWGQVFSNSTHDKCADCYTTRSRGVIGIAFDALMVRNIMGRGLFWLFSEAWREHLYVGLYVGTRDV